MITAAAAKSLQSCLTLPIKTVNQFFSIIIISRRLSLFVVLEHDLLYMEI